MRVLVEDGEEVDPQPTQAGHVRTHLTFPHTRGTARLDNPTAFAG